MEETPPECGVTGLNDYLVTEQFDFDRVTRKCGFDQMSAMHTNVPKPRPIWLWLGTGGPASKAAGIEAKHLNIRSQQGLML